jgi:Ca2+/Na+ antiporter
VTGESYHDLENEGIAESMLILIGTLLLFIVLMLSTKFVLLKWHADIFVVLYIIYVVFALAKG